MVVQSVAHQPGAPQAIRFCWGCPRCQDFLVDLCGANHTQYHGLHPVCRQCGHCALRGEHDEDGSDLVGDGYNIPERGHYASRSTIEASRA